MKKCWVTSKDFYKSRNFYSDVIRIIIITYLIVCMFACGDASPPDSKFVDDFKTTKLEFDRCEQNNVTVVVASSVEYDRNSGLYHLIFGSQKIELRLVREVPLQIPTAEIIYSDRPIYFSLLKPWVGKISYTYAGLTCYARN